MNGICKNCGKIKSEHLETIGNDGDTYIVCPDIDDVFTPSGRVSVPVEFIGAVKELIGEYDLFPNSIETNQYKEKVQSMLTEIEKGGEG